MNELRVTFYIQVTSYCLLHALQVTFIAQVTSYFLHLTYELLFTARVTSYFIIMSDDKDKDDKSTMKMVLS